ncbi:Uncharacterised protein [Mycobacterium tuberculosis]|nr:Uncharacterised protein [Mycobacterium tuberculosis]
MSRRQDGGAWRLGGGPGGLFCDLAAARKASTTPRCPTASVISSASRNLKWWPFLISFRLSRSARLRASRTRVAVFTAGVRRGRLAAGGRRRGCRRR